MKPTSIFITYNPNNDIEQTLAVRLHTIGAVNGFQMYLPDRYKSNKKVDSETIYRIQQSDYFILFSTQLLSDIVVQEINHAASSFHDKSRIIVVYDGRIGKNIKGKMTDEFTALKFDPTMDSQDAFLKKLFRVIQQKEWKDVHDKREILQDKKAQHKALAALFGIGLGLFVLSAISE